MVYGNQTLLLLCERHRIKKAVKQNEDLLLVSIGAMTIVLILCTICVLWSRTRFLYVPIDEKHNCKKILDMEADGDGI